VLKEVLVSRYVGIESSVTIEVRVARFVGIVESAVCVGLCKALFEYEEHKVPSLEGEFSVDADGCKVVDGREETESVVLTYAELVTITVFVDTSVLSGDTVLISDCAPLTDILPVAVTREDESPLLDEDNEFKILRVLTNEAVKETVRVPLILLDGEGFLLIDE